MLSPSPSTGLGEESRMEADVSRWRRTCGGLEGGHVDTQTQHMARHGAVKEEALSESKMPTASWSVSRCWCRCRDGVLGRYSEEKHFMLHAGDMWGVWS